MAKNVKIEDNSVKVRSMLEHNVHAALNAMGQEAVGLTVDNMEHGYGKPIRITGELQRDVAYEVNRSAENTVDIGNTLEYALDVHEGTRKMRGRPYLLDALQNGRGRLMEVAEHYLKQGF